MCASLPTMADVIGYEEKDPRVLDSFSAGYPRFFKNPLLRMLNHRLAEGGVVREGDPLLPTAAAALDMCKFIGVGEEAIHQVKSIWSIRLPGAPEIATRSQAFLQHTGSGLSSREAEALLQEHFGMQPFREKRSSEGPDRDLARIRACLHEVYGTASEGDIHLFRSGMNAFYSGFRALQAIQLSDNRDLWIQLGWLYVDTSRILERFALPGAAPIQVFTVLDSGELKDVMKTFGHRVAGIVTEVPTNPLVQTPDVEALRELADRYGAALVLDPTLVSPHNVNILQYADLHINSLTKYAASEADVMMGALALNSRSRFYDDLLRTAPVFGSRPAAGDLARMAEQIGHYPETIRKINASTEQVAAFLEGHPGVKSVFWARSQPSGYNYNWLQHHEAGPGGIISFSTHKPLAEFYDASRLVKSPSFGARFTMMCPFMYLAHYDLVSTASGRDILRRQGIDPDLIRLSVGLEPAAAIIDELGRTL